MEWSDHGIIVAIEKYNEPSAIISCLTSKRGLCRGFIKNTRSKVNQRALFIGNLVHLSWSARLERHLGNWKILSHETISPYFYHDNKKLIAVSSLCALVNCLLIELEAQESIFEEFVKFLYAIKFDCDWLKGLIFLELLLLQHIGYGLDFSSCTVTGVTTDLAYISPNTGKAVCSKVGKPYHNKLFILPRFLLNPTAKQIPDNELIYALNITKYFFEKFTSSQNNLCIPKIRIILQDTLRR